MTVTAGTRAAAGAPASPQWVAMARLAALMCGVFMIAARLLRLGFIANFLSVADEGAAWSRPCPPGIGSLLQERGRRSRLQRGNPVRPWYMERRAR